MTTAFWCLLAVILIPYVLAGVGGYYRTRQFGAVDNKYPRLQAAKAEGVGARAVAAQANAWEAVPVFASAVFVAHLAGADPGRAGSLGLAYLAARIGHAACYLGNWDAARSMVFLVSLVLAIALFVQGAF